MKRARYVVIPLLVLPLAWLLLQGLGRDPREIASPLVGRPAPDFRLAAMDGSEVSLSDYRGQPVLVNFWASWCFECIEEHRVLIEAREAYGDDFAIVGILYQDSVEDARQFLIRYGDAGWPSLIDSSGTVAIDYGVSGVPESFFIDAEGTVRHKQWGAVTSQTIESELVPLIRGASGPESRDEYGTPVAAATPRSAPPAEQRGRRTRRG